MWNLLSGMSGFLHSKLQSRNSTSCTWHGPPTQEHFPWIWPNWSWCWRHKNLPSLAGPSAQVECSPGEVPSVTPAFICFSSPTPWGTISHVKKNLCNCQLLAAGSGRSPACGSLTGKVPWLGASANHYLSRSGGWCPVLASPAQCLGFPEQSVLYQLSTPQAPGCSLEKVWVLTRLCLSTDHILVLTRETANRMREHPGSFIPQFLKFLSIGLWLNLFLISPNKLQKEQFSVPSHMSAIKWWPPEGPTPLAEGVAGESVLFEARISKVLRCVGKGGIPTPSLCCGISTPLGAFQETGALVWKMHRRMAGDHPYPLLLMETIAGMLGTPGKAFGNMTVNVLGLPCCSCVVGISYADS